MPDNLAYLSLGSNIDPERNLPEAVSLLAQYGSIVAVSSAWQSPPAGFADQPDFLNAALIMSTPLTAAELRGGPIAGVEKALGRVRTENKNAPRTIDIDILLFNHEVLNVGQRHIPSPEIYERAFVAQPLAEIAPEYVHPETGETLAAIAARVVSTGSVLGRREDVNLTSPHQKL